MIRVSKLRKVYRSHGMENVVLDDVSFQLRPGQKLAVIGKNGAGKSTLIRLLGKVEFPTSGVVDHRMSVSWPLGFGGAFQGSLTGIDNMRFIARIYHIDYARMRAFVEEFSELGQFLYQPVKTYSSGMRARLAFALSLTIEFECYLIDEVIMVGDQRFHERCNEHLFNRRADRALIIASHDASFIRDVCDSGIVLSNGKALYFESVREAMDFYQEQERRPNGLAAASRPTDSYLAKSDEESLSTPEQKTGTDPSSSGFSVIDAYISNGAGPEHLVEALYRHVLGRSPDPEGFAHFVRRLKIKEFPDELPYVVRDFVNCEEARMRMKVQG
ncbi:MAG: kpsT [Nevskia sp.]|nr:kpsT [Nevskia sp.]